MRVWLKPDVLARLGLTVDRRRRRASARRTWSTRRARSAASRRRRGQQFTYTVRAQGRLVDARGVRRHHRARRTPTARWCASRDVARVELGALNYQPVRRASTASRPAVIAAFQLPGSNALDVARAASRATMDELEEALPARASTTRSRSTPPRRCSAGIQRDRASRWSRRSALVMLVVFIFLQSWRATLIPLLTVPVSLIGAFAVFPLLGFSINTLSLFGAGAGDRPGRRRRHRRGRGGRAPHRGGHVAARGDAARRCARCRAR